MSARPAVIQKRLEIGINLPEETSLWFRPTKELRPFHCLSCGRFMFARQHRIVIAIEDNLTDVLKVPPISFTCARCNCVVHVHILA